MKPVDDGETTGTKPSHPAENISGNGRTPNKLSRAPGPWQRLLSIPQAAEYLGVCAKTMWRLVWESEIPQIRIARRVLVDIRDLDRYIESQKN
jgi:excisionase family DNA binding protein